MEQPDPWEAPRDWSCSSLTPEPYERKVTQSSSDLTVLSIKDAAANLAHSHWLARGTHLRLVKRTPHEQPAAPLSLLIFLGLSVLACELGWVRTQSSTTLVLQLLSASKLPSKLLKHRLLGSAPGFQLWHFSGGAWEGTFLSSSQVILMFLVQGPHLETWIYTACFSLIVILQSGVKFKL